MSCSYRCVTPYSTETFWLQEFARSQNLLARICNVRKPCAAGKIARCHCQAKEPAASTATCTSPRASPGVAQRRISCRIDGQADEAYVEEKADANGFSRAPHSKDLFRIGARTMMIKTLFPRTSVVTSSLVLHVKDLLLYSFSCPALTKCRALRVPELGQRSSHGPFRALRSQKGKKETMFCVCYAVS